MNLLLFVFACFCIFQSFAYYVGKNDINWYDNGSFDIDTIIFISYIPSLSQKLDQQARNSLLQTIRSSENFDDEEFENALHQWYSRQNPTTQTVFMDWLNDVMKASQVAKQRTMQVMNQSNFSSEAKSTFNRFQQFVNNADSDGLRQLMNSVSQPLERQLNQILLQVYGSTLNQFMPAVNMIVET